jgi:hypothetical protein
VCDKEEKDMPTPTAEPIDIEALGKAVPNERIPHILEALNEVELIRQGKLPFKTARDFLRELDDEDE